MRSEKEFCKQYGITDEELAFFKDIRKNHIIYQAIILILLLIIAGLAVWLKLRL